MNMIRDYQPSDQAACVEVFNSNVPTFFAEVERTEYLEFLNDSEERQHYLVLELNQKVVGCGGYLTSDEGRGGLSYGMIENKFHGLGLGKRLLLERLQRLIQIPTVTQIVLDTGQHTFAFFRKLVLRLSRSARMVTPPVWTVTT